ncbi:MAG: hypothetical protein HY652_00945 [Acidobacteria bacterium]|nr:hypothetical protein [Acidobacteriota bacterium]
MDSEKPQRAAPDLRDLKRQAQLLYRERTEAPIPTSDSLSMKKYAWLSLGLVLVLGVLLYVLGTRGTIPPERENKVQRQGELSSPSSLPEEPAAPAPVANPQPAPSSRAEAPATKPGPAVTLKPVLNKKEPHLPKTRAPSEPSQAHPAADVPVRTTATTPPEAPPAADPAERDRQRLAHDIVLEKNRTLAELISKQDDALRFQRWEARPARESVYIIQFIFLDEKSNAPASYVWQVDINSGKVVPLSHLARQLA